MSYTRGETYIWSDGEQLHLWSDSGMDHWKTIERYDGNPHASGVQISEAIADEFAIMRFAELLHSGAVDAAIARTMANWAGNTGCAALEKIAPQMRALAEIISRSPIQDPSPTL